jgi:hypothetical protein
MRFSGRAFVAVALAASQAGCSILGPTCLSQQKRGQVQSLTGSVQPRQVVTHTLRYDQRGSQNNIEFSWTGKGSMTGLRLMFYATGPDCLDFVPPPADFRGDAGPCRVIGSAGGYLAPDARPCALAGTCSPSPDEIIPASIIITGPGNGAPPGFSEYKLHIVGDARVATEYSVSVTWFFGPDC